MKSFFAWWYRFSLPKRGPDTSPAERERTRYARLTSIFTLMIFILSTLLTPWSFYKFYTPLVPIIAVVSWALVVTALVLNKLGWNIAAAASLVLSTILASAGNMVVNPLDPTLLPIFADLVIPVILAGALMPPVAALVTGGFNSVFIIAVVSLQQHTPAYDQMLQLGRASVAIALPLTIQVIVSVVTYVIMRNLITTIRRADRAEEIVALQTEIAEFERSRAEEKQQLEEGIAVLAQVHAEIARGNLHARVPLRAEHVLWQVAVPLNNLLNRLQQWKNGAEQMDRTRAAINNTIYGLQEGRKSRRTVYFQEATRTPLDPLLPEINYLSMQVAQREQLPPSASRPLV